MQRPASLSNDFFTESIAITRGVIGGRSDHKLFCQISIRENQNCGTKLCLGNDIVVRLIGVDLMGFWMKNEWRS